jgi:prepilin-type N-terminal cleavage/methylation domain-containing protein
MKNKGFTLVELLVVMAILGVLVTLVAGGFRTAQMRGRDGKRKSDLKEIANSLEVFYSDHGEYPDASGGRIQACIYDPIAGSGDCTWGASEFTDNATAYFKTLPEDPVSAQFYVYRVNLIVDNANNQKYQLFARLENPEDQNCLDGDCANSPVAHSCGTYTCNFAVTSANTTPTE